MAVETSGRPGPGVMSFRTLPAHGDSSLRPRRSEHYHPRGPGARDPRPGLRGQGELFFRAGDRRRHAAPRTPRQCSTLHDSCRSDSDRLRRRFERTVCGEQALLDSDFYDHPDLYDALLPADAHVPFYAGLARQQGGAVLELACGTGQLTVPIAQLGLPATVGLDRSRAMLKVARGRAAAAGAAVAFVQADMRDFALGRAFDLIFVARNSLLHLLTTADLLAALTAARRHLAPGGVLAFDVFNPDVRILARPSGQRLPVMEVPTAAFGRLVVEDVRDYDSATQISSGTWYVSAPGNADAWIVPMVLRSIFPQELPLLISAAGFELVSRFGDLSGAPFGAGSRAQVCVCRPRA